MPMKKRWAWMIGGICLVFLFLLPSCSEEENEALQTSWDLLQAGPPASSSAGTFTLSALGGAGSKTTGGNGGTLEITGANVRLIKEGSVETDFTVPFEPENLGSNPKTISTNTTITLGDFVFTCDPTAIPGDNPAQSATGLKVLAGATLTILPALVPGCDDIASVAFEKDIIIEGSITAVLTPPDKADISLSTNRNLIIQPGGGINTNGDPNATGPGGNGGDIRLAAPTGKIVLQGALDSSGGDGTSEGGNGGAVTITAGLDLFNTGAVTSNGGLASSGTGGNAGAISLEALSNPDICLFEGLFNSGALSADGGDGTENGGEGGDITLTAETAGCRGDLINAGALSANGGSTTGSTNDPGFKAGDGGDLTLTAHGTVKNSGSLLTNGGNGAETVPVGEISTGGSGGAISITLTDPTEEDSIQISANISANRGNGTKGGSGSASIKIDAGEGDLHLLNFISFDLAGGDGKTTGGAGGRLTIRSDETLFNELEIVAIGGNGTSTVSGVGGEGGEATLSSAASLINYGKVTLNGGYGDNAGGSGGSVTLASTSASGDLGKVLNTADLVANGGTASDITSNLAKGVGGAGGEISLIGEKLAANRGSLSANGGDATKLGGDGGIVSIRAVSQTDNAGNLSAAGGNARVEDPEVFVSWTLNGGDGGIIVLSTEAQATANSGSLSVVKGTGSEGSTAVHGHIYVDGSDVTPSDGVIQP